MDRRERDAQDGEAYTVRAVAGLLGMPTATLRSWTRRYGVGPTGHRPGRHRYYTAADLAVLQRMQSLISEGASPAHAARAALEIHPRPLTDPELLLSAALRLDHRIANRIVEDHLTHHGVVMTWNELCRPVFNAIDARQFGTKTCIDVEHLLSWTVTRCLQRIPLPPGEAAAAVVLACADDESHTLPLEALRAALCENGVGVIMLGASVPRAAITDLLAHHNVGTTVVLWAQTSRTADAESMRAIVTAGARAVAAGPGWNTIDLPAAVVRVDELDEAVDRLCSR